MIKKILNFYNSKTIAYKILLALFSLVFVKSISITPFSLVPGAWGIVLGVLLWAVSFAVCLTALYFLSKISWEYKKTKIKKTRLLLYMIPSLSLSAALLLIYFPGIMSWDSMYIWRSAMVDEYSNLHPITYVLFVNLLSGIIKSPWLVIAVQFVYSAFIFAYIGCVFEGMGLSRKLCWAAVLVISFYPVHAFNNISMLKDVPYIMSLVLLSAVILKSVTEDKFGIGTAAAVLAVSLAAMFSRHNGLLSVPFALVFLTVYFLMKKKRKEVLTAAIVTVLAIIGFFAVTYEIEHNLETYWTRSNASDILMMPSAQLSYTIDKNWGDLTSEEKETAEKYLDTGYINYQKNVIDNWQFNNRYLETLNLEGILADRRGFIGFYFDTFRKFPLDMIKEYEQITAILWATPNYGYTLVRNYGIPQDFPDLILQTADLFPKTAAFLDSLPHIYFLLRPALWLWLSLALLFVIKKGRRLMGFIIISPMIANAAGFLLGTPAQNVRYLYCSFSCFVILLAFAFMSVKANEKKESGKTNPAQSALSE